MGQPRVIIIGAGPAGVRCAETLVAAGLRPTVVDENRRDGGQIYRRQPDNFTRPYAKLYGTEAERAQALHGSFDALRGKIDYLPETLAWNIADGKLHVMHNQRSRSLPYDALVICSGATDRLMPVKGWHYAGTYSLGASQIALKAQACAIGSRIVFMGTGPLLYLVASQYVKAGASVAAVLDTSPFMRRIAALPKLLARPSVLRNGFTLVANLKRAGVQVLTGITPLEIKGAPAAMSVPTKAMRWRWATTCVRKRNWPTWRAAPSASTTKRASGCRRPGRMAVPRCRACTWRATA
jgi:NADPH-dependent 2,4-dienoyl-CoA reductase/sulfur reductase-like enzyme